MVSPSSSSRPASLAPTVSPVTRFSVIEILPSFWEPPAARRSRAVAETLPRPVSYDLLVETATGLDNRSWSRATIERAGERFIRVSAIDDPSLPRAVVFHDSFGTALIPLLAEHFSRAYFVRGGFNPAVVKRENPDVVIQIMCERFVMQPAPTSYPR